MVHYSIVRTCVLFLLWSFVVSDSTHGKVIYVDDDAIAPGDGSSWETAYRFLQDALADAESAEKLVEVKVAQGVYKPDRDSANPHGTGKVGPKPIGFLLVGGVSLLGGFAGVLADDPNVRDVRTFRSVLTGDLFDNDVVPTARTLVSSGPTGRSRLENSRHIVTILESQDQVVLDGFTITAGHCFLDGDRHAIGSGGGVNSRGSRLAVRNCVFEHNFAANMGGALYVEGGVLLVEDSQFIGNAARSGAGGEGGAIACCGADVMIINTTFTANLAIFGGAVLGLDCPKIEVSNCLFVGNVCFGTGAALSVLGGLLVLEQCTLTESGSCDTLFASNSSHRQASLRIAGCIFRKDAASITKHFDVATEVAYSNVFREMIWDPCDTIVWGPGNTNVEPLFADPGYWDPNGTPDDAKDDFWVNGDYHLKSQSGRWDPVSMTWVQDDVTSPCIDAGDPNSPIGQEPFPNGGRINMGAYGGTVEASKSYFGEPACETIIAGDINGDRKVDFQDFVIVALHWPGSDIEAPPDDSGAQRPGR